MSTTTSATSATSATTKTTASSDSATEIAPRTEPTTSGVKCQTTAKGFLQPEFTMRYASADEALAHGVTDLFALYDQFAAQAAARGLQLVTQQM